MEFKHIEYFIEACRHKSKSYYRKLVSHYARRYGFVPKTAFESSDANQLISLERV